jgi:hypothetical protein
MLIRERLINHILEHSVYLMKIHFKYSKLCSALNLIYKHNMAADVSFFETCPFFRSTRDKSNDSGKSQSLPPEVFNLPLALTVVSIPITAFHTYYQRPNQHPLPRL